MPSNMGYVGRCQLLPGVYSGVCMGQPVWSEDVTCGLLCCLSVSMQAICGMLLVCVSAECSRTVQSQSAEQSDTANWTRRMATRKPTRPKKPEYRPVPQDEGAGATVLEREVEQVEPPGKYQVVLLNDDYTPMEFVVEVIQQFFSRSRSEAVQIMLKVHVEGRGVCGVYSRDIAATKADLVCHAAQEAGHPLQCVCEPVD